MIGMALILIVLVIFAGHIASLIVLAAPLWYLFLYVVLRAASAPVRQLTANLWISLVTVMLMTAAFVAPMRGAVVFARAILGRELPPLRSLDPEYAQWCLAPPPWFWTAVGVCGALYGLWLAFGDGLWRLRVAKALTDLPTSKARSAAAGLAEFRGIVRRRDPAPSPDAIPVGITRKSWVERASKAVLFRRVDEDGSFERKEVFFLEDESGRILVDAQGASFREPLLLSLFIPFRAREIVLTRRLWTDQAWNARESWVEEGDPVQVIGRVEETAGEAGADRLVVRPSSAGATDFILQLLSGELLLRRFRGEAEVFILSDGSEESSRRLILGTWYHKLAAGTVWTALSLYIAFS